MIDQLDIEKLKKRVTRARAELLLKQPFFAAIALRMKVKIGSEVPTMGTDGRTLFINPEWTGKLNDSEIAGVMAHECMHVVFQHCTRRGDRDPERWNLAGDYCIDPVIKQSGMQLPKPDHDDRRYHDKTADQVYNLLPKGKAKAKQGQGKQGQGDDHDHGGSSCGGLLDMKNDDGSSMSEAERARAESDLKIAVQQAAQTAKMQGKLPANLQSLIDEITKPSIDWKSKLRDMVQRIKRDDYSFFPPNRRFIHQGIYLPSLRSESVGDIVIAFDTSGSVSDQELSQYAGELSAILEEVKPERIILIQCDSHINSVKEYTTDDLPLNNIKIGGRGGTSFDPVFQYVKDQNIDPEVLIYFTDLECNFPEAPPYRTIWACWNQRRDLSVPFGEYLPIELTGGD